MEAKINAMEARLEVSMEAKMEALLIRYFGQPEPK